MRRGVKLLYHVREYYPRTAVPTDVCSIETYLANIKTKLDLKDAAALVCYATTWVEHP